MRVRERAHACARANVMPGREAGAILSWRLTLDKFCDRMGRPRHLYKHKLPVQYEPKEVTLIRKPGLRKLAAQWRIPYWREMRTDEIRAALIVMSSRG